MPDLDALAKELDIARTGLNSARNVLETWRNGKVAGVNYTAAQRNAVRSAFEAGMQAGKDGFAAVEQELLN